MEGTGQQANGPQYISPDLSRMGVDELRKELSKRDLDSTGNKPDLIDKLKVALAYEEKRACPQYNIGQHNLSNMNVPKLKEELNNRHLDSTGIKPNLMTKLKIALVYEEKVALEEKRVRDKSQCNVM